MKWIHGIQCWKHLNPDLPHACVTESFGPQLQLVLHNCTCCYTPALMFAHLQLVSQHCNLSFKICEWCCALHTQVLYHCTACTDAVPLYCMHRSCTTVLHTPVLYCKRCYAIVLHTQVLYFSMFLQTVKQSVIREENRKQINQKVANTDEERRQGWVEFSLICEKRGGFSSPRPTFLWFWNRWDASKSGKKRSLVSCSLEISQFSSTFSCAELAISISPRKHFRFLTAIYFINCDVPEWRFRIRRIRKNMQKQARKCKNMQRYVQYIIPNKALGISTPPVGRKAQTICEHKMYNMPGHRKLLASELASKTRLHPSKA